MDPSDLLPDGTCDLCRSTDGRHARTCDFHPFDEMHQGPRVFSDQEQAMPGRTIRATPSISPVPGAVAVGASTGSEAPSFLVGRDREVSR